MAKKYALLIGNNQYDDKRLQTLNASIRDVEALERVLKQSEICAFDEVKVLPNPSFKESMRELSLLFSDKTKDDLVLFYFSGHGVKDHVCHLFFAIQETEWGLYDGTAIPASQLKSIANKSASQRQVWILDCCHSGAIAKGFKGTEQFISEDTFDVKGYGREIITATDSLQYAMDGNSSSGDEEQSLFTRCLVEGLETGEAAPADSETITVEQLYQYVHGRVKAAQPAMTPRYWCDRAEGRINLARNPRPVFTLPDDLVNDLQHDNVRARMGALHEIEEMLQQENVAQRQAVIVVLTQRKQEERDRFVYQRIESLLERHANEPQPTSDTEPLISAIPDKKTRYQAGAVFRDKLKDGSQGLEMVVIPDGKFRMGDSEDMGRDNEKPAHTVNIKKSFALGKYPVTFKEYDYYCEQTGIAIVEDESWGRDARPLINVSWEEAVAYAKWLSSQTGKKYRLPSEAEWEYAARAGTETEYWWGDEASKKYANYKSKKTTPVDHYQSNDFGLHDMLGNVWEWVEDCYHDSYKDKPMKDGSAWVSEPCEARVLRGGSWSDGPRNVRSAFRNRCNPQFRNYFVGFRLAQDL